MWRLSTSACWSSMTTSICPRSSPTPRQLVPLTPCRSPPRKSSMSSWGSMDPSSRVATPLLTDTQIPSTGPSSPLFQPGLACRRVTSWSAAGTVGGLSARPSSSSMPQVVPCAVAPTASRGRGHPPRGLTGTPTGTPTVPAGGLTSRCCWSGPTPPGSRAERRQRRLAELCPGRAPPDRRPRQSARPCPRSSLHRPVYSQKHRRGRPRRSTRKGRREEANPAPNSWSALQHLAGS
mmetsp:Transcript_100/g.329  ORF Transcript_100/g.329 Transcript_100/m.329 type:complete len:235 (-) Transcript_100:661-1365(-)